MDATNAANPESCYDHLGISQVEDDSLLQCALTSPSVTIQTLSFVVTTVGSIRLRMSLSIQQIALG